MLAATAIESGALYIVATPIGNLNDMSYRAIEVLKKVDLIMAEDTRHSQTLLTHFSIHTPLISFHEHNEQERIPQLLQRLNAKQSLALISDAGTPLISDPGYQLVSALHDQGKRVIPIPGPCSIITALSASGLPTDRFLFEGFLSAKQSQRRRHLETLKREKRTQIYLETPHRLEESLADMAEIFGKTRVAVLARELTKRFETLKRDTLENLLTWVSQDTNQQRGEMVILVAGEDTPSTEEEISSEAIQILKILRKELPLKQAVKLAHEITGSNRNQLYSLALTTASDT